VGAARRSHPPLGGRRKEPVYFRDDEVRVRKRPGLGLRVDRVVVQPHLEATTRTGSQDQVCEPVLELAANRFRQTDGFRQVASTGAVFDLELHAVLSSASATPRCPVPTARSWLLAPLSGARGKAASESAIYSALGAWRMMARIENPGLDTLTDGRNPRGGLESASVSQETVCRADFGRRGTRRRWVARPGPDCNPGPPLARLLTVNVCRVGSSE
jgi:hypothetical protein